MSWEKTGCMVKQPKSMTAIIVFFIITPLLNIQIDFMAVRFCTQSEYIFIFKTEFLMHSFIICLILL